MDAEGLANRNPLRSLDSIQGQASERKLRLWGAPASESPDIGWCVIACPRLRLPSDSLPLEFLLGFQLWFVGEKPEARKRFDTAAKRLGDPGPVGLFK